MTKRICILLLAVVLVGGLVFLSGCQTPEEVAEEQAARASAWAAVQNASKPTLSTAGALPADHTITLSSSGGTVQPADPMAAPAAAETPAAPDAVSAEAPALTTAEPPDPAPASGPAEDPTPEPAPSDPYARAAEGIDYEMLRLGSEGATVERLQQYLTELGYLDTADRGHFGPETEDAVTALQERNSLVPDGIVGNSTWDLLLMSNARPAA